MHVEYFNNLDVNTRSFISFAPGVLKSNTDYGILVCDSFEEWKNEQIENVYKNKKNTWSSANKDINEMILYHGCPINESIENIRNNGFDLNKLGTNTGNKGLYGAGIYFSKNPNGAAGYSVTGSNCDGQEFYNVIISKVLVGKSFAVPAPKTVIIESKTSDIGEFKTIYEHEGKDLMIGYDSHSFKNEIVIFDTAQILPLGILYLHIEPIEL